MGCGVLSLKVGSGLWSIKHKNFSPLRKTGDGVPIYGNYNLHNIKWPTRSPVTMECVWKCVCVCVCFFLGGEVDYGVCLEGGA